MNCAPHADDDVAGPIHLRRAAKNRPSLRGPQELVPLLGKPEARAENGAVPTIHGYGYGSVFPLQERVLEDLAHRANVHLRRLSMPEKSRRVEHGQGFNLRATTRREEQALQQQFAKIIGVALLCHSIRGTQQLAPHRQVGRRVALVTTQQRHPLRLMANLRFLSFQEAPQRLPQTGELPGLALGRPRTAHVACSRLLFAQRHRWLHLEGIYMGAD